MFSGSTIFGFNLKRTRQQKRDHPLNWAYGFLNLGTLLHSKGKQKDTNRRMMKRGIEHMSALLFAFRLEKITGCSAGPVFWGKHQHSGRSDANEPANPLPSNWWFGRKGVVSCLHFGSNPNNQQSKPPKGHPDARLSASAKSQSCWKPVELPTSPSPKQNSTNDRIPGRFSENLRTKRQGHLQEFRQASTLNRLLDTFPDDLSFCPQLRIAQKEF